LPCGPSRWAAGLMLCALAISGHCQVYVGTASADGGVVLSNFLTPETPVLLLRAPDEVTSKDHTTKKPVAASRTVGSTSRLDELSGVIELVARRVDIAPRLIHAVISAESNYDAKAVSPKGAVGLMQLLPATARRFGIRDPFVVQDNVYAGASYLKWLMGYFEGDIELVLAAYNAGEQAVVRAGHKVPKYPETQAYVRRIMADLRSTDSLPL
jgi:soluble lytic murein transglycosylase-like protein